MDGASVILSKRQTNPFENSFFAPKYKLVTKTALLRQFAKCTLLPYLLILSHNGRKYVRMESSRIRTGKCRAHSHTIRFNVSGNKPGVNDSEIVFRKCKTSVLSSEDLTSTDETILFDTPNTSVSLPKQYCLTSETILFRSIIIRFCPGFGISMHTLPHEYS